jgi:hypothetical protein
MPPEAVRDNSHADKVVHSIDVWSVGCLIHEVPKP